MLFCHAPIVTDDIIAAQMRWLYSLLLYLLTPLVLMYLFFRGLRSRDYLSRWSERFGFFDPPGQTGGIVVHAVSMGEVNAASTLVRELARRYPDEPLCLTTFTPTGSDRVRVLFGSTLFHVYVPLDLPGAVRRFFDRVRPRMLVILETEIWPNLYHEASARGIPILVANARISDRSIGSYRRFHRLIAPALAQVSMIGAQSAQDAARLAEIGAGEEQLSVTGNLKFDVNLPASLSEEGDAIRTAWGTHRLVLLAGSTHEGDEIPVLNAFSRILGDFPDALLVLVPRHPERFGRAAQAVRNKGLSIALRSAGPSCSADTQCFLIDTMGELLRYYSACDIAFVGGTFENLGGHNLLEPAALGKPILVGPHTYNSVDITQQLLACGAALQLGGEAEFEQAVRSLFNEPERRDRMGRAGIELVKSGQGAVERTLLMVDQLITRATG